MSKPAKTSLPADNAATAVPRVLVITGQDPYWLSQTCQKIIDALLNETEKMTGLSEPKAPTSLADVLDELRTMPFLAPCRVVLIKDAKPFIEQYGQQLLDYLDNPSPTGYLILTADSLDGRTKFAKTIQQRGLWRQADPPSGRELPAFLADYAATTHQVKIDLKNCQLLIEWVGDDPGRLCREIDKLAVYVHPKKMIAEADIQHIVGQDRVYGAFNVIDQLMNDDIRNALNQLNNMFAGDKDAEYTVIGAFAYSFRQLFSASAMMTKGFSAKSAAEKVRVFGSRQAGFIRQLQRFSLNDLSSILTQLGQIDYAVKTGRTTAQTALERLIINVWQQHSERQKPLFKKA